LKKTVWIFNHYATDTFYSQGGRHYWFAEFLIKEGYNPIIFCASTVHNTNKNIDTKNEDYKVENVNGIPYVFVKTPSYFGNGIKRVLNMISFYINLFKVAKDYAKLHSKPDIILASSVHPLTLVAGIKIAKLFKVQCICEVRDLWPETLVAYGALERNNLLTRLLYRGEKWIYNKADKLIFTMEGGKDYIVNMGWNKESGGPVDLSKVYHINNGVDLETYTQNISINTFDDIDLDNKETFKIIYAGSIRKANNVKRIVETAEFVAKKSNKNIKFLIYGDGPEKNTLKEYCITNDLNNVVFKGLVEKSKVPYLLSKSDLNIMHFEQNNLKKYGASLNKMFEYFASGKPTVSDCEFGYDVIKKYNSGIVIDDASAEDLADVIIRFSEMPEDEYNKFCQNALKAAQNYDFKLLTNQLANLL
jgi:glycosyltransferase involved in cell wall biosynthesis